LVIVGDVSLEEAKASAEKYLGKITFWGELDRQHILPFGTEEDVRESVRRIKKALL
jgi:predicted Zn-dependent peptidase